MIFLRKYRLEAVLFLALILMILGSWMMEFHRAAETVQEEVLRLHILAASNEAEDQQLKLAVRDRILKEAEVFKVGESKDSVELQMQTQLPTIAAIAEDELRKHNCQDTVSVQLCRDSFSTRVYDDFTLPAGEYDALRIVIGEGEGKNWWCVLFPSLCLSSSGADEWFTEHELQILQSSPQWEPRFALYEWVQSLKNS